MTARFAHATSTLTTGALGVVQVWGDVDAAFARMRMKPVAVGGVGLRSLLGVDEGIVARPAHDSLLLMPHAGVGVSHGLHDALVRAGLTHQSAPHPSDLYPEARSDVEARALAAAASASSPLGAQLLLRQHDLWNQPGAASDPARDRVLQRLLSPPTVVLVGGANIGKSTLVNALAREQVSIVADEPGTTRDHVGVLVNLRGLVVQVIDAPGLRDARGSHAHEEASAQRRAWEVARKAELLLLCEDPRTPALAPAALASLGLQHLPSLRVLLRADLLPPAPEAPAPSDTVRVSVRAGEGLEALRERVREALLPDALVSQDVPWRFWRDGDSADADPA